jgi:hypothetical protein
MSGVGTREIVLKGRLGAGTIAAVEFCFAATAARFL